MPTEAKTKVTPVAWSIRCRGQILDSGVARGDEREVLGRIMRHELGQFKLVAGDCYSVSVGGTMASAYGDEFERVASSSSVDEANVDGKRAHLFDYLSEEQRKAVEELERQKVLDRLLKGIDKPGPAESYATEEEAKKFAGHYANLKHAVEDGLGMTPSEALRDKLREMSSGVMRGMIKKGLEEVIGRLPVDTGFDRYRGQVMPDRQHPVVDSCPHNHLTSVYDHARDWVIFRCVDCNLGCNVSSHEVASSKTGWSAEQIARNHMDQMLARSAKARAMSP